MKAQELKAFMDAHKMSQINPSNITTKNNPT